MNIDIRSHIKSNFKGASTEDIENSINSSIESKDEVILPGLGVFFEIVWENCTEDLKNQILNTLLNNI